MTTSYPSGPLGPSTRSRPLALVPLALLISSCSATPGPTTDLAPPEIAAAHDPALREHSIDRQTIQLVIPVPAGKHPNDFAVISGDNVRVDTNARIGSNNDAHDSVFGFGAVQLREGATVYGDVFTAAGARLFENARLRGNLTTASGIVQYGESARLDGLEIESKFEIEEFDFSFEAPAKAKKDVIGQGEDVGALAPGAYKSLQLLDNGRATLRSGVYFFETLLVTEGAEIYVDAANGPVRIVVKTTLDASGQLNSGGNPAQLLLVYQGKDDLAFKSRVQGTIIAPAARVAVANRLDGMVYGFRVFIDPDVGRVLPGPFDWTSTSSPQAPTSNPTPPGREGPRVETPATLPKATPIDVGGCAAQFDLEFSQSDEDGDGSPDATRLIALGAPAGCDPERFCVRNVAPDGTETYTEAPPTPLYSDELPVPAAAVTDGCTGERGTTSCPTLSNGQQAGGCDPEPADPECLTVTLCPDRRGSDDRSAPGYERRFDSQTIEKVRDLIPSDVREIDQGEVVRIDAENNPLYIDPCDWDEAVFRYDMGFDVTGNKLGEGAYCESNDACNSGVCNKGGQEFFGECTKAESKVRFDLGEGNGVIHISSGAGIPEARSRVGRAAFYPSSAFDVTSTMLAYADAVIFGYDLPILNAEIRSQVTECRHELTWSAQAFESDFTGIPGRLGLTLEPFDASAYSEGQVDTGADISDSVEIAQCERARDTLWAAEKRVNEALHEALVASTYFNEAGSTGAVITSRDVAVQFVNAYESAAREYEGALSEFLSKQATSINHQRSALVAEHERGIEAGYTFEYPIGPITLGVELGGYGRWGVRDLRVENGVRAQYTTRDGIPCDGVECMRIRTESSGTPWAVVGGYVFASAGIGRSWASLRVGAAAELDLVGYETPLTSQFTLERVTWDEDDAVAALRDRIPAQLQGILGTDPEVINSGAFLVRPQMAQFQAPFAIGGGLDSPGEVRTTASFLSGRVKLWAKLKLLFIKKKWEKTLFDWEGTERSWKVADGNTGDALYGRVGMPVPNMVLLPKLTVNPQGGTKNQFEVARAIESRFDTRHTRINSASHTELALGQAWDSSRCAPIATIF